MFTKFGVPLRVQTQTETTTQTHKVTDATDSPTHDSAITGVGNDIQQ